MKVIRKSFIYQETEEERKKEKKREEYSLSNQM